MCVCFVFSGPSSFNIKPILLPKKCWTSFTEVLSYNFHWKCKHMVNTLYFSCNQCLLLALAVLLSPKNTNHRLHTYKYYMQQQQLAISWADKSLERCNNEHIERTTYATLFISFSSGFSVCTVCECEYIERANRPKRKNEWMEKVRYTFVCIMW